MSKYISKLTKKEEASMKSYAKKWIKIGLKTGKTDWKTFDKYMPICYEKANIEYPKNIVHVNSPLVGALAASIAGTILRKRDVDVDGAVGDAVRSAVSGAVSDAVSGAVGGAVRSAVRGAVSDAVDGAVGDAVRSAVRSAVRGAVSDAVDVDVDDAVRSAVSGAVSDAVRSAVSGAADVAVSGAVSDAVDGAVRVAVSGAASGAVDVAVNDAVKTAISIAKKAGVELAWHYWLGGQFWVGYWWYGIAFVNFFFDICKLKLSKDIMDRALAYRKVCESVNYIWPNKNFVIVCARPSHIDRDKQGRLHSTSRMAIQYPDGWGLYLVHGTRVPEKVILRPEKLTKKDWMDEPNVEVRRIIQDQMGKNFVKKIKGTVIHKGKLAQLYEIDLKNDPEKVAHYVKVKDSSTPREYYLRIPPSITNADEGVAWTFGMNVSEYKLEQES